MTTATANEALLGLATTEDLYRELIARDTTTTADTMSAYRCIHRVAVLAEMLGGLDATEREYRTVGG